MIFSIGRYWLRYRKSGRFYWDDAAHGLALMTMLAICGLYSRTRWFAKIVDGHPSGVAAPAPISEAEYLWFRKNQLAVSFLFWICLYAVKLAFLMLYRMLFVVSASSNRVWWSISVFTLITFWVGVAIVLTICGPTKHLLSQSK